MPAVFTILFYSNSFFYSNEILNLDLKRKNIDRKNVEAVDGNKEERMNQMEVSKRIRRMDVTSCGVRIRFDHANETLSFENITSSQ